MNDVKREAVQVSQLGITWNEDGDNWSVVYEGAIPVGVFDSVSEAVDFCSGVELGYIKLRMKSVQEYEPSDEPQEEGKDA